MPHIFLLPDIGEGLEEAEIVEWLVAVGDEVTRDQPLVEILTDKASSELPSPVAGFVMRLGAAEGERIQVGAELIKIDDGSDGSPDIDPDAAAESSTPAHLSTFPLSEEAPESMGSPAHRRPKASPATRKLALELAVDLATVVGSGPGGRITAEDVRSSCRGPKGLVSPDTTSMPQPGSLPSQEIGQMTPGRHKLRGIRGVVARNMVQAWSEIPHIHSLDEIDASKLVDFRSRIQAMDRPGAESVTLLAVAAMATVRALIRYPLVNGHVEGSPGDSVFIPDGVHLGIATATSQGLLVPVVHNAHDADLFTIAEQIAVAVGRARSGNLTAAELSGATFTITNYGALGGRFATPIIPPRQGAILGLGAVAQRPLVVDGEVEARPALPIVVGADHRIVDGDLVEVFRQALVSDLLEPLHLLVGD